MGRSLVADGFQVLAFDNRGSGATTTDSPFTFADMTSDVVALWDHLGIAQSHLLGVSMGGEIAQTVATDCAERVLRLILVSTTADSRWVLRSGNQHWGDDLPTIQANLEPYFSPSFVKANQVLIKAMAKNIFDQVRLGFHANAAAQRQAFDQFNWVHELGNITAKTLVIHGDADAILDPSAAVELARLIPDARLELLPGMGHLLLAEAPKALHSLVTNFLSQP